MEKLHVLSRSRFVVGACGLSLILMMMAIAMPYFALRGITTPLIVHFTDTTGIDRAGHLWDIIEIGILGFTMVLINTAIAIELEKRRLLWAKFLALGTLVLASLIFVGVLVIISVN